MVPGKLRTAHFTSKGPFYEYSSSPAVARIRVEGLVAEIRQDTTANPTIYHCVVQPVNSPEVLFFAQSYTMEEAEEMAMQFIRELKGETA